MFTIAQPWRRIKNERYKPCCVPRNMIINIHSMALNTGLPVLATLNLADNLLSKIPFMAIENLNALKMLGEIFYIYIFFTSDYQLICFEKFT